MSMFFRNIDMLIHTEPMQLSIRDTNLFKAYSGNNS